MQARIVAASRGARWFADGWKLFRAAPVGWMALVFGYWLLMTLISIVPLLGAAAAAVLVPGFSVGFMAAARAAERGGRIELALLFDGFRQGARQQIGLGLAYFACLALVIGGTALADGGGLARWMLSGERPATEAMQSEEFVAALLSAAALYSPVMLLFWFAPPLAAWHSCGVAKSLFFSFIACVMNWKAFLVYGAVALAVMLLLPFLALSAVMLAGGAARLPVATLVFPLLVVMLPTLFASFYASYRDVFG